MKSMIWVWYGVAIENGQIIYVRVYKTLVNKLLT